MPLSTPSIDVLQQHSDAGAPPIAPYAFNTAPQAAEQIPLVCPWCRAPKVRKNGTKGGRQRFLCTVCGKTWGQSQGTPFYRSKRSPSTWQEFLRGVETKVPLRELAERCGISLHTACQWRKKYLAEVFELLIKMLDDLENRGVLKEEADLEKVRRLVESEINRVYRGRSRKVAERRFQKWQIRFVEKLERERLAGHADVSNTSIHSG